jgi:predicted HTH transcriptional regulator
MTRKGAPRLFALQQEREAMALGTAGPRWRNETLAWFLSRLGYAEAEGQGLRTIRSTMLAVGCPPVEFDADAVHCFAKRLCTSLTDDGWRSHQHA